MLVGHTSAHTLTHTCPGASGGCQTDPTPTHGLPGRSDRVLLPPRIGAQFFRFDGCAVALTPVFREYFSQKSSATIFRFCPAVKSLTQKPTSPNHRLPLTAFETHNGRSSFAAGSALHAPKRTRDSLEARRGAWCAVIRSAAGDVRVSMGASCI